jgi:hypothetical protein
VLRIGGYIVQTTELAVVPRCLLCSSEVHFLRLFTVQHLPAHLGLEPDVFASGDGGQSDSRRSPGREQRVAPVFTRIRHGGEALLRRRGKGGQITFDGTRRMIRLLVIVVSVSIFQSPSSPGQSTIGSVILLFVLQATTSSCRTCYSRRGSAEQIQPTRQYSCEISASVHVVSTTHSPVHSGEQSYFCAFKGGCS